MLAVDLLFVATFALLHTPGPTFRPANPLEQGHSHNDYRRPHPLFDALQLGFKSVEADVFLIDTTLQVGHSRYALHRANTLQSLYLAPLRRLQQTQGGCYARPSELWLYVEFKNDGASTYTRLRQILARYHDILSTPRHLRPNGVRIVLTGGYPRTLVLADPDPLVFLDGHLTDLGSARADIICTVSAKWSNHFKWHGRGPISDAEVARLSAWNDEAQRTGQKIRFWNAPAATATRRRAFWTALLPYSTVLVGADKVTELAQLISQWSK